MAPLSFFKSGSGSGSVERGGSGISRESISKPQAVLISAFDDPGYAQASSFSDQPVLSFERPATPPHTHLMNIPGGSGLARSVSASSNRAPSVLNSHGSPSRYNPARLLRRKTSRRGEREEVWGVVPQPANAHPNNAHAPAGGVPATRSDPISISPPALTVSPPLEQPSPTNLSIPPSAEATRRRRAQGHVARAQSGGGIPVPPAGVTGLAKFGSTRSARSFRSIQSDGETDNVFVYARSSRPRPALATAFDLQQPSTQHPSTAHPFLAQGPQSVTDGTVTPPNGTTGEPGTSHNTPLSPPRRPTGPQPPPPRFGQVTLSRSSSREPRGSIDAVVHPHYHVSSRPTSPSSVGSFESDGPGLHMARDTAEWLARKPSVRRNLPVASAFSASFSSSLNGNGQGLGGPAARNTRRSSTRGSFMDTHPSVVPQPIRQSFGPSVFANSGLDDRDWRHASEPEVLSSPPAGALAPPIRNVPVSRPNPDDPGVSPISLTGARSRTPDNASRGESYDVSVVCTQAEGEVRWEIVLRRVNGGGDDGGAFAAAPGPLALAEPSPGHVTSRTRAHAPPFTSSVNLSLALDVEKPSGKLAFIALPAADATSAPTRVWARNTSPTASPRSSQPLAHAHRSVQATVAGNTSQLTGAGDRSASATSSHSSHEGDRTPPGMLQSPVSESLTSTLSPVSPETPGTPATFAPPVMSGPASAAATSIGSGTGPGTVTARTLKRHAMHDYMSAATPIAPPPPPRRDRRRELGVGANANANAANTSGADPHEMGTPNGSSGNSSPTPTPPLGGTHRIPPRPHRHSSRISARLSGESALEQGSGKTSSPLTASGHSRPRPVTPINGGPKDQIYTLGAERFRSASPAYGHHVDPVDHLDAMEHIMTPDSASATSNSVEFESVR